MSSRGPPLIPESTTAGIVVNPRTLERVIPATKRADGSCVQLACYRRFRSRVISVRKEIKIRPGFTPVEDVATYRSTRVQQMAKALPKGTVIGYTPPAADAAAKPAPKPGAAAASAELSKAAAKNAKRAEKRKEKRKLDQADFIRKQFEDDPKEANGDSKDAGADTKQVDELTDKLKATTVS